MTTSPTRLGVKFSLQQEPQIQPAAIVPIFQRWIQDHTLEGMLIDVIDYKHVPAGPGVILIADEADYAYDLTDGQTGLIYIRKRALPDELADALQLCFLCALKAARALEAEAPGDIIFNYSAVKISFLDRMHFANKPETFLRVHTEVAAILGEIYGETAEVSRKYDDERQLFALECGVTNDAVDADSIISRLEASRQAV